MLATLFGYKVNVIYNRFEATLSLVWLKRAIKCPNKNYAPLSLVVSLHYILGISTRVKKPLVCNPPDIYH